MPIYKNNSTYRVSLYVRISRLEHSDTGFMGVLQPVSK